MEMRFIDWLSEALRARDWNYSQLARNAGIAQSTISMVVNGQSKPGIDFCVGVARALKVSEVEVLRRAGLIASGGSEVDALTLRRISDLLEETTAEERKELLEGLYFNFSQILKRREKRRTESD